MCPNAGDVGDTWNTYAVLDICRISCGHSVNQSEEALPMGERQHSWYFKGDYGGVRWDQMKSDRIPAKKMQKWD